MADNSDLCWSTMNEYLSNELASNSDDEKMTYRAERRPERKSKDRRRRRRRRRLGPADRKKSDVFLLSCFKYIVAKISVETQFSR